MYANVEAVAGVVATIALFTVVVLMRSYTNGRLGELVAAYRVKKRTNKSMSEIAGKLDEIDRKQDRTYDKMNEIEDELGNVRDEVMVVGRTVAVVHANDEEINQTALRDRLNITDLDQDIVD